MRLVNVLIERLDLNLKDLTETHDKKLKRPSTAEPTDDTEEAKDKSPDDDEDDDEAPSVKKMKLDYFPLTVNVSDGRIV